MQTMQLSTMLGILWRGVDLACMVVGKKIESENLHRYVRRTLTISTNCDTITLAGF